MRVLKHSIVVLVTVLFTCSCAQHHGLASVAKNEHAFYGEINQQGVTFQQRKASVVNTYKKRDCKSLYSFGASVVIDANAANVVPYSALLQSNSNAFNGELTLSPGDLLELQLENGEGFEGNYVIDTVGRINIPIVGGINAIGKSALQVSSEIEIALIKAKLFHPDTALVTLKVLRWAEIALTVEGAVFEPGRVLINSEPLDAVFDDKDAAVGDYQPKRFISEALRAASGIRPDAALDKIILVRNGWKIEVDLTGIISGQPVVDIPLVAGDHIIVPSTGCFQQHLVRPSQITPKGFRIFISNLIDSSLSNANAAVGRFSSSVPYGTRLLQAAVTANCVGGKAWTNASRRVMLASEHPITKEMQVIERSIEEIVRNINRDDINPYLMPNDTVACYDSDLTNLRDVADALADIIVPFKLL